MIGEFYNGPQSTTTDDIMRWITGGYEKNTSADSLISALAHFYGVQAVKQYDCTFEQLHRTVSGGTPVIALVHYGSFACRLDRGFTGGHWIVVTGLDRLAYQGKIIERVIVNDPDWWGAFTAQGAYFPIVLPMWAQMWGLCHLDRNNPDHFMIVPEA
jgi:hypothetical protein